MIRKEDYLKLDREVQIAVNETFEYAKKDAVVILFQKGKKK
jgi:hypothetical protein